MRALRVLTGGELKKGRYVYYHCTGYRGKCGEPYTREETLTQQFAGGLRELILSPAILQRLTTVLLQSEESERLVRAQVFRRDQAELEGALGHDVRRPIGWPDQCRHVRQNGQGGSRISVADPGEDAERRTDDVSGYEPGHRSDGVHQQGRSGIHGMFRRATAQIPSISGEGGFLEGGELRKSFQEPFEEFRLSNSASATNCNRLGAKSVDLDNWR